MNWSLTTITLFNFNPIDHLQYKRLRNFLRIRIHVSFLFLHTLLQRLLYSPFLTPSSHRRCDSFPPTTNSVIEISHTLQSITYRSALAMAIPSRQLFIDGEWKEPIKKNRIPVINPATEQIIGDIPAATTEDVDVAVEVARKALKRNGGKEWASASGAHRAKSDVENNLD
ncbi:hypothetical protein L6452_02052 [Arctium lappa]|uniref:Uncharacterized protein n=1 Tax=Arctium lappa TaxID=4217 RepID=A0ACB9FHS6_ARCLA|nr:hypothetical protein L6452_02052 [Arctium lappa]